jgi:hypothetical protein
MKIARIVQQSSHGLFRKIVPEESYSLTLSFQSQYHIRDEQTENGEPTIDSPLCGDHS